MSPQIAALKTARTKPAVRSTPSNIEILQAENRALRQKLKQREAFDAIRKKKEEASQTPRALFRTLLQSSPVVFYAREPFGEFGFTYVSENVRAHLGCLSAALMKTPKSWESRLHFEDASRVLRALGDELPVQGALVLEYRYLGSDGQYLWLQDSLRLIRNAEGRPLEIAGSWLDVTDRHRLEESLKDEMARFHRIAESVAEIVWTCDAEGDFVSVSPSVREVLGFEPEEILAKRRRLRWKRVHPEDAGKVKAAFQSLVEKGQSYAVDYRIRRSDEIWIRVREKGIVRRRVDGALVVDGTIVELAREQEIAISSYLEERDRLQEALKRAEERFRLLVETMPSGVAVYEPRDEDRDFIFKDFNRAAARIEGVKREAVLGRSLLGTFPGVIELGLFEVLQRVSRTGLPEHHPAGVYKDDRIVGWRENFVYKLPTGEVVAVYDDVTERKQAEERLERAHRLLLTVIDSSPDWIFAKDLEHRYLLVNRSFAASRGMEPQDMIGRPDTDFWDRELCLGNRELGLAGYHDDDRAAFAGDTIHHPDNNALMLDGSIRFFDTFKIPLREPGGAVYGVLGYSRDVTERRMVEAQVLENYRKSEQMLAAAVGSIASVSELRDPHTRGHQKRTARLAGAVAAEIGLTPAAVEDVRLAAMLHDVGTIGLPPGILTKPGKLTEEEFALLKEHTRRGGAIIEEAGFPPAIVEIVLRHHERLDGSGYPGELKGDAIGVEAMCLAVADVVEAMCADRAHRPAPGLAKALEEIERNAGILYDARVAEACLRIFREKGFTL